MTGIISEKEKDIARKVLLSALRHGASQVRITLSKGEQSSICTLDGNVDRILSSTESSLLLQIFAGGAYGTFSTNLLNDPALDDFVRRAVDMTKILAPDPCYGLPERSLKASGVNLGNELGLVDGSFRSLDEGQKKSLALECCSEGALSEEGEYSDSLDDNLVIDSDGFEGRSIETSYNYSSSVTVEDGLGNKYSGCHWDSMTFWNDFKPLGISAVAISLAKAKFGAKGIPSGKYDIVVDRCCSSRLLRPVIMALSGYSIHQHNSFLEGKLGERVFCPQLSITDRPAQKGEGGSRLFDSEGVALKERPIVEGGVLKTYFINSYMSRKMGMEHTTEAATRPMITPWISSGVCNWEGKEITLHDLLHLEKKCLYITGFNGGNCNSSTGDFSFGVEGFLCRDGEIVHPVSEVLLTGNMLSLWSKLIGAGSDSRKCQIWRTPSLAFADVDINA